MKILKWIIAIIIIVIAVKLFTASDTKETGDSVATTLTSETTEFHSKNKQPDSGRKHQLTDVETKIATTLIKDDVDAYIAGGKSKFKYNYIVTTALKTSEVYQANEARGDKQFKGKDLIVSGVIESINSGFGDIPYVILKGSDEFFGVTLSFSNKYRSLAEELNKGQRVTYACTGAA